MLLLKIMSGGTDCPAALAQNSNGMEVLTPAWNMHPLERLMQIQCLLSTVNDSIHSCFKTICCNGFFQYIKLQTHYFFSGVAMAPAINRFCLTEKNITCHHLRHWPVALNTVSFTSHFVSFITALFMMCENNRKHYGPMAVFVCLHFTSSLCRCVCRY